MINAINSATWALLPAFTTAAQAGTQAVVAAGAGHSGDTGIEINGPGAGVGAGTSPGAVGTLAIAGGTDDETDVLTGTLSLKNAAGANVTLTLGQAGPPTTWSIWRLPSPATGSPSPTTSPEALLETW